MRGVSSCIVTYSVSGLLFGSRWREMERAKKKNLTYSLIFVNSVSAVFQILTVSMSDPTMSSRCVVMARPSISGLEPGPPTRSEISKMMLVNPSLSIHTSWLSGTCLSLLRNEVFVSTGPSLICEMRCAAGKKSRKLCAPYVCEVFWQIAGNGSAVEGGVSVARHG